MSLFSQVCAKVVLGENYIAGLLDEPEGALAKALVPLSVLRRIAGRAVWALAPVLRSFIDPLLVVSAVLRC